MVRAPDRPRTRHTTRPRGRRAPRAAARRARRDPQPVLQRCEPQPAQAGPQQRSLGAAFLGDGVADEASMPVPRPQRAGELERQAPAFGHHPGAPLGHAHCAVVRPTWSARGSRTTGEPGDRRPGPGLSDAELAEDQHQRRRRDRVADVQAVLADERQQHMLGRETGLEPRELAGLDRGRTPPGASRDSAPGGFGSVTFDMAVVRALMRTIDDGSCCAGSGTSRSSALFSRRVGGMIWRWSSRS